MAFDVLATIVGEIADRGEAERLAREIAATVTRARTLGCVVQVRDMHIGREVVRITVPPRDAGPG